MSVFYLHKPRQMAADAKNCMPSGVNEVVQARVKMRSKPVAQVHDSALILARSPIHPRSVENSFQVYETIVQAVGPLFLEL